MFNFNNKKKDVIREHLGAFQDNFTKEQKCAILCTLMVISNSDGEVHPKEVAVVEQIGQILGIEITDPAIERIVAGGEKEIIRILNTLDRRLKEWYVLTIHGLIAADGKVEEAEMTYALSYAMDIGISADEFIEIIEKNIAISKFLRG